VGLDHKLCKRFFESVAHVGEATSLEQILEDYLYNHQLAFTKDQAVLKDAGFYRYRKEGERSLHFAGTHEGASFGRQE